MKAFIALMAAGLLAVAGVASHHDAGNGEWATYGLTPSEQRFSPLSQIDAANVGRLGLSWYHEFDTDRGQEATSIVVGGVLYTSTAWSKVYAFDAVTGRLLWSFDPEVPPAVLAVSCCDAVNRGVAVANGRVFVATFDGRLIALDTRSGKVIWSRMTVEPGASYTSTGAVRVFGGKVLIGNAGAEFGVRGYVSAYDEVSGRLLWRFYTVPNPNGIADGAASDRVLATKAAATWHGDVWKQTGGGGTVWDAMAYDAEAGLLYIGVGNGTPHDHLLRSQGKGDNLFLSSIVALHIDRGAYAWHYQTTPGESWDFTATQPIILAELTIDGERRKVLMQAPKNGFFYVLDRLTGALISANNYVPVNWATGIDPKSGRPIEVPGARYEKAPWRQMPGALGGHSWHPMAYSPITGLVYIPAQQLSTVFGHSDQFTYRPGHTNMGFDTRTLSLPDDPVMMEKIRTSRTGRLIAWDPVKQAARWAVDYPIFLNGGVLATAGGLVFQGTGAGDLVAYDAADGRRLWSYPVGNGVVAPPIAYAVAGVEYIAVMVGYGGSAPMLGTYLPDRPRLPGRLMVFRLDGRAKAAPVVAPPAIAPDLAGITSSGDIVRGLAAYNDTCLPCHGINARSRFTADLRRSPMLRDEEAWRSVVIDGAFAERGMASFARFVTPSDAENIRAYVLAEARKLPREDIK